MTWRLVTFALAFVEFALSAVVVVSILAWPLILARPAPAMPGMNTYEAMSAPGPRTFAEDPIVLLPNESRFGPKEMFVIRASHDEEVMPPCDEGDAEDAL